MIRTFAVRAMIVGVLTAVGAADTGAPEQPVALSAVLAQLSENPQVRDRLLASLDKLPNAWGLIGPDQRAKLRDYILNRNWSAVDHFPGLTVAQLKTSVSVADSASRKYPFGGERLNPPYVELGDFADSKANQVPWLVPEGSPRNEDAPAIKDLGYGLTMGDPPHPELWKWHAQSQRAAYLLNRLSLNDGTSPSATFGVTAGNRVAHSPQELIGALTESGCDVKIEDARYFANFGHLHFKGQDVLMPFWLNTRLRMPGSNKDLLVPVSHAEEELRIRCPDGNADVTFYFGIDGMAEFRTMDTLDQYWVGKNVAHVSRGQQAIEVTRLLGAVLRAYAGLHARFPDLPFRGYYSLGVCQDAVAAVERHMFGTVSLFPITHDPNYFRGDGEVEQLFASLPDDRQNGNADWARVRGSLPAHDLADIRIPELRETLQRFEARSKEIRVARNVGIPAALCLAIAIALLLWRRSSAAKQQTRKLASP